MIVQRLIFWEQLAWLIAFISSVISDVKETYPNFAWWALVYTFFCIIGVLVTVASDAEQTYNVAVCAHTL
jgi:SHO1 osmosensor